MGHRTARLLGGLGRALITLGLLVIAFAGYQLWGTGLAEQRAQDDLAEAFAERRDALWATSTTELPTTTTTPAGEPAPGSAPTATTPPATEPPATTPPPVVAPELSAELRPELGETMGRITIPAIEVDKYVVHGVRRSDLRRGPGHYPDSPLPGQAGNVAIAGHRTTYGAPFGDLDDLAPGDEILVETLQGSFRYEVTGHPGRDGASVGHFIVTPDAVEVLDDFGDNRLTLTACHPKYSAAQRIVVTAQLVSAPAPAIEAVGATPPPEQAGSPADPGDDDATGDDGTTGDGGDDNGDSAGAAPDDPLVSDGTGADNGDDATAAAAEPPGETLGWNTGELPATVGWGAVTAAAAAAVAAAGRAWRRWPARLLGAPFVAVALFVTFSHLDRLLPAL